MDEFHETVRVVDHLAEEQIDICSGFLITMPEYKGRALIVVKEMLLPTGKTVKTAEGLSLSHRTLQGEHFLWDFAGIVPETEKGRLIIERARLNFRPKRPSAVAVSSRKRQRVVSNIFITYSFIL